MDTILRRVTPSVGRRWLFVIAGVLWGGVGVMLCARAVGWLAPESAGHALLLAAAGIAAGVVIYRFKFAKLADKNIKRIDHLRDRESILAFQAAWTYVLIVFMMGLGIALRHSAIPKPYLAVLYTGIGLGMLLASLRYFAHMSHAH